MKTACPSPELLVAHLDGGLAAAERDEIEQHLRACASCVQFVRRAMHRLRLDAELDAAVPDGLAAVVRPVAVPEPPAAARRATVLPFPTRNETATAAPAERGFRYRVFVPAALAAMAVLVIATGPPESVRSLFGGRPPAEVRKLRIVAPVAEVLDARGLHGRALAELRKGAEVEILGGDEHWYRVRLADGRKGWIDKRSFQ